MKTIHIFRTHDLEVGTAKNGTNRQRRPGYRWVAGYAEALPNGATSQASRLHEFQAIAKESGAKLKRHATEEQARAGLEPPAPVPFPIEEINLAAPNQQARGFILRPTP